MNSRERVGAALDRKHSDRPPLDGWFLNSVVRAAKRKVGLDSDEELLRHLGIDFRRTCMMPPKDFGKEINYLANLGLCINIADYMLREISKNEYEDEWGVRIKISGDRDLDWRYSFHPLATEEGFSLANLTIPSLNKKERFDNVKRSVDSFGRDYMICAGVTSVFRKCWLLVGFDQFLQSLYLERKAIEKLATQITGFIIEEITKYIEAGVDIIELAGDLGHESAMFINPELWREIFKPKLKKIISETRKKGVFYYLHSDGNIQEIIPDLIECGIDILNPIQPECMDPAQIKKLYGHQLVLDGTMSLQRTFAFGNENMIKAEIENRITMCGYNGGLILGPSNAFSEDIDIEKILFFYRHVQSAGQQYPESRGVRE